jgi:multidrug resistance protein MdtO
MEYPVFADPNLLHAFFVSVFLMRTTKIGVVFFVVAIVAIYTQSLVDISPDAETLVRGILWVWVAVNYPIAVTLIVNSLLMPVEPEIQLKRAIGKQLSDMASLLSADATLLRRQNTLSQAGRDIQTLYRLLRYKTMRDKHAAQKGGIILLRSQLFLNCVRRRAIFPLALKGRMY